MMFGTREAAAGLWEIGLRIVGVISGFSCGWIAQELLITRLYPGHGTTGGHMVCLLPITETGSPPLTLVLLYLPIMATGLLAAGVQRAAYGLVIPGHRPSGAVLISAALLASVAHAVALSPVALILGTRLVFVLSASAVAAAAVIVAVTVALAARRGPLSAAI